MPPIRTPSYQVPEKGEDKLKTHSPLKGPDTRRREPDPTQNRVTRPLSRPIFKIRGEEIESLTSHKFLGVILDQELRFKEHANYTLKKGTIWVLQFRRLAKISKGISARFMRRYYISVAIPKVLYAADVFLIPPSPKQKGTKGQINRLARIQRMASLHITCTMRTSPTDCADAFANLLPFQLLVKKIIFRAAIRLATLPISHPLHKHVRKAASRFVKKHRSPLHKIMHAFSINPSKMEEISPTRRHPKWSPAFRIKIAADKEAAKLDEQQSKADIKVYTDSSCIDGKVGTAAILYRNGREKKSLRKQLGSQKHHTVYEAEVVGLCMGAELIRTERGAHKVMLGADNQAALKATQNTKSGSGKHLVDALHDGVERAMRRHRGLELDTRWVPGHLEIPGNERADEEAKKAAAGEGSPDKLLLPLCRGVLPRCKSAAIQHYNKKLKQEAAKLFKKSPRYQHIHNIDPSVPSLRYQRMIAKIP